MYRAPGEFRQQFEHDRIIFASFHCHSYTTQCFAERAFFGFIVFVDHVRHFTVQTYIAAVVQQHAINPVVLAETVFAMPGRFGIPPLRAAFGKQVQDDHIAGFQILNHLRAWICLPGLCHPYGFRIIFLHGLHNRFSRGIQVYSGYASAFMEGIHAVEVSFAVEFVQFFVIQGGYFLEAGICRLQECRAVVTTP